MRGLLETIAFVGVVIVLAAFVLVSIVSTSILAVDRASAVDAVGAFVSDDDLTGDGWCPGAMAQTTTCR